MEQSNQRNNQQQQRQQSQEKTEQKQFVEAQKIPNFTLCPACGYQNEPNAKFCEECGADLAGKPKCPNCKSDVYEGADICEVCGTWLLSGKCCFCYADISDNDKFCPNCGNSTEGIVCPNCGTKNIFDFCKKCNTPLTEAAHEDLKKINSNPFFQNLFKIDEELKSLTVSHEEENALLQEIAETERQIALEQQKFVEEQRRYEETRKKEEQIQKQIELENFLNKSNQNSRTQSPKPIQTPPPKPLMSDAHKGILERAKANLANAQSRKSARLDKEGEFQQQLNQMAQLTFQSGQEARRFFNATKPRLYPAPLDWLCNYANYTHPGPHDCARPDLGGKWVPRE